MFRGVLVCADLISGLLICRLGFAGVAVAGVRAAVLQTKEGNSSFVSEKTRLKFVKTWSTTRNRVFFVRTRVCLRVKSCLFDVVFA